MMTLIKEISNALSKGSVVLEYTKKNGEKRTANATLNFATIYTSGMYPRTPEELQEEIHKHYTDGYFDLDKGEWRRYNPCDVRIAG